MPEKKGTMRKEGSPSGGQKFSGKKKGWGGGGVKLISHIYISPDVITITHLISCSVLC